MEDEPEVDLERLLQFPGELMGLTFDQLRTLLFVAHEGSPHKAANLLEREQSSVTKQLDHLNHCFQSLCGEPLAVKQARGEDYAITPTGKQVVRTIEKLMPEWHALADDMRREVGKRLVVATTTFTVKILAKIWDEVIKRVDRRTDLQVRQIRTRRIWDSLEDRSVDLVIGGIVARRGKQLPDPAVRYDFAEWSRGEYCFRTNLSYAQFQGETISREDLPNYPLVLPDAGVVIDAIKTWYGDDYRSKLNLPTTVLDVHYATELLRRGTISGFMVTIDNIIPELDRQLGGGNQAEGEKRKLEPGEKELRVIRVGHGFEPLDSLTGLFGRKGERSSYGAHGKSHPLVLFWELFEKTAIAERAERAESARSGRR